MDEKMKKMTVKQLREMCKEMGINGYSNLRKEHLIITIQAELDQHKKRKEFLELKSNLCGAIENDLNYKASNSFKKLVDTINIFIKIFGESSLKVAVNFSVNDFFNMLKECKDHKEFKELFSKVELLVNDAIPQKRVIGVYSPRCMDIMKKEFKEWGDEEDWEYIVELERELQPLYKDLKFKYMN